MLTKIVIVVALSCGAKFGQVQKRMAEVSAQNPGAVVTYRIDKKAACSNGVPLIGKDAKAIDELGR